MAPKQVYIVRMSVSIADTRVLADAFRECLNASSASIPRGSIDEKLLRAALAQMADEAGNFIATRVPDGNAVAAPLAQLGVDLAKNDSVGPLLASAQASLVSTAKSAVSSVVFQHTLPVWLTAVTVLVVPWVTGLYTAGLTVGDLLVKGAIPGVVIFGIVRFLSSSTPAFKEASGSIWTYVSTVGAPAQRLIEAHIRPTLVALKTKGLDIPPPARPVIEQVRSAGKGAVAAAYSLLIVAGLIFLSGFATALGLL